MLELFQREECPACARVRGRLTELGLDFVARQVPEDPKARERLETASRQRDIPVLIDPDHGMVVTEADDIIAYLDETYAKLPRRPEGSR